MEEKRYLKWYNKLGYGSGDIAGNMVYAFVNSFVMIYLTDTVGLSAGIVGTLIMFSKLADGITDIFFGRMIDRTHSRMGKARPWMLYSYIGNAVALIALFAIPDSLGENVQYAYFFIAYTLLNAIFYTANNISFGALTSLITKNGNERVQMGSIRFMFSMGTSIVVSYITVGLVDRFGSGAAGWRAVAILYAVIGMISNTITVFSVRELPEEELADQSAARGEPQEQVGFAESLKMLFTNKYYLIMVGIYLLMYINSAIKGGAGTYYMTYIFHDTSLLGSFSLAFRLPILLGMVATPILIKRFQSIRLVTMTGYAISAVISVAFVVAGYMDSITLMLVTMALSSLASSPLTGSLNALVAEAADYTYHTHGKRIDGMMFSCSSLGIKLGSGVGTAISGWLLEAGGYINGADVQPDSAINMLRFMYLWIPLIVAVLVTVLLFLQKVEKANRQLAAEGK